MSLALTTPLRVAPDLSKSTHARGKDWVLYRGDSLALLEPFDEQTFDLIFADPPYFLSNGGFTCQGGKRAPVEKGKWDVVARAWRRTTPSPARG